MYNCVWSETSLDPDNRSHYAIATLVNNALDRSELGFVHRNGFKQLPPDANGAVVIVHGEHQVSQAQQLFDNLNRLAWSVVIVIGDDMALFPSDRFLKDRCKVWMQMPVPGRHDHFARKIICGFPHDAPAFLARFLGEERIFDWSYAGQVNHAWRKQCVEQLRMLTNGFLYESPRFWNGIPRDEYYRTMAQSKIVACPAGACTPDTLRLAEALEAGCIPVAEDRWPPFFPRFSRPGMTGYWRYVLGEEPPFPTLTDWGQFPEILKRELSLWPANVERLQTWWKSYKERYRMWMQEDVHAVS